MKYKPPEAADDKNFSAGYGLLLGTLVVLLCGMVLLSLCSGRFAIRPVDALKILFARVFTIKATWNPMAENVVFVLRLPRITASILVGGALALSGATYQGVFRNTLVSPDLLGVSSGAGVGAALAILCNAGSLWVQLAAFICGIITVFFTSLIPRLLRNSSATMVVVSGIIMVGILNSLMGVIKYFADPATQLPSITYWQMGSLARIVSNDIFTVFPAISIVAVILIMIRWNINILSLGDNEARTLGINTGLMRNLMIICATVLTACSVCISGTIGWVGLVIPHISRMLTGPDNVRVIPVSFVLGSIFMLCIDTLARVLTSAEIPLSILSGLVGAPFYFYVLSKQRMKLV
jgi:iron complex transport system permease protein